MASSIGLASGIDYETIIAQTRSINSRPIALIQQQSSKLNTQSSALQSINKLLTSFKAATEALSTSKDFFNFTSSSTNSAIASASASTTATEGSYSVQVRQLASAHRIASQGVSAQNTSVTGGGTFSFKLANGAVQSVALASGDTLQDVVDKVNALSGSKVKASLINDGSATDPYRLVLTSSETGLSNQISIVQNDTTLNLTTTSIEAAVAATNNTFDGTVTSSGTYTGTTSKQIKVQITSAGGVGAAGFRVSLDGGVTWSADDAYTTSAVGQDISSGEGVQLAFGAGTQNFAVGDTFTVDAFNPTLQKPSNALIEVDGIQVQRSSNTFDDVVTGLSISAKKVDSEAATISIRRNTSGSTDKVNAFINSYNQLVQAVNQVTAYDTATKTGAALFGDSSVRNMVQTLRNQITSSVPFLSHYKTMASVGISFDGAGLLKLNSETFSKALADDPEAVQRLFSQGGSSSSSLVKFISSSSDTKAGSYSVNITQAAEKATVTASQALGGPLAANEKLTLIDQAGKTVQVQLTAGQTLTQIIDTLNATLTEKGSKIVASNENGHLKLTSTEYGAEAYVRVRSDIEAGVPGQLGIGTTNLADYGLDVAGTINGAAATGKGQTLSGADDGAAKGLQLMIQATAPTTATVTLTEGLAYSLNLTMKEMTDSKTGLLALRTDRITKQQKAYEDQISRLNMRLDKEEETMRAKFTALETKLASLQSQGNFLQTQLASLI